MQPPLKGIRIVEMGQLLAIPHLVKLLADMGAEVIRIESCTRLDPHRNSVFYDNKPEGQYWNRAANFYDQNRNKIGLTLDLSKESGRAVFRELISVSDIFTENFTPRVMKNFSMEYEDLAKIRPDIIMLASTGYGYDGPWANYGAVGPTTEAASGLAHLSGYKDGPPMLPEIPYTDFVGAEHGLFVVMAALHYRHRTGKGQFLDLSQSASNTSIIGEAVLDYTVNGRVPERIGNRDLRWSPQGVYPCQGNDKWIAISITNEVEWVSLCRVMGSPSWCQEDRFETLLSRRDNHDELDLLISQWTRGQSHYELMHLLQTHSIPAGAVLSNKELLLDPHLLNRGFYQVMDHPKETNLPNLPYPSRPWVMSGSKAEVRHPASTLGGDNRFVLAELLGWTENQIQVLEEQEVIGYLPAGEPRPPMSIPLERLKDQGRVEGYDSNPREILGQVYDLK